MPKRHATATCRPALEAAAGFFRAVIALAHCGWALVLEERSKHLARGDEQSAQ